MFDPKVDPKPNAKIDPTADPKLTPLNLNLYCNSTLNSQELVLNAICNSRTKNSTIEG